MKPQIHGIHHISIISGSARENFEFYTETLGLRLVKKTVNYDDPGNYHLYYGDDLGQPGTLLTFFPWEGARPGKQGAGQVTATAFVIPRDSLQYWNDRLSEAGVEHVAESRFGDPVIRFRDPHGTVLELIATKDPVEVEPIATSPVPAEYQIRGFHSATASVRQAGELIRVIEGLGMVLTSEEGQRRRFRMDSPDSAPGAYFDLIEDPQLEAGSSGAGIVHHIAFRAHSYEEHDQLRLLAHELGQQPTPAIDRNYFQASYFRTPGGILFELSTDPPGLTIDEPRNLLGQQLVLPKQYERLRSSLEQQLVPLTRAENSP